MENKSLLSVLVHLVGQQLIAMSKKQGFELGFWVRNARGSSAEVDFVIIWKNMMIPVEVKSGKTGTLKSLNVIPDLIGNPQAFYG